MQAFLRGLLPTAEDAEDAFQETWVRVVKSAGKYRGGKVKPYLAVVARSVAIEGGSSVSTRKMKKARLRQSVFQTRRRRQASDLSPRPRPRT